MPDDGPEPSTTEEHEFERLVTRQDGASVLRRLADGVANGSVELGDDEATVAVPEQFELEIEYEAEDEAAELEVELEWPVVDGEAVAAEQQSEPPGTEATQTAAGGGDDAATGNAGGDEDLAEAAGTAGGASDAPVDDVVGVGETASRAQFELYRDRSGEWRWRLVHDNGNIIADSGEGYDRKATARKGLESVIRNAPGAPIVVQED